MKITKTLAKSVREYIFVTKRKCNIINKQLVSPSGSEPFIVYATGFQTGFKFTFATEEHLLTMLTSLKPNILMYCKIDRGLYMLYEALEYKEITQEDFVDKAVNYITNSMIVSNNVDTLLKQNKEIKKNLMRQ